VAARGGNAAARGLERLVWRRKGVPNMLVVQRSTGFLPGQLCASGLSLPRRSRRRCDDRVGCCQFEMTMCPDWVLKVVVEVVECGSNCARSGRMLWLTTHEAA
jgi:hypothetical protein